MSKRNTLDLLSLREPIIQAATSIYQYGMHLLAEQKVDLTANTIKPYGTHVAELASSLRTKEFERLLSQTKRMMTDIFDEMDQEALLHSRELFRDCVQSAYQSLGWDFGVGEHSQRVGRNASAIAKELGIEDDELGSYYWAGKLHDIGKLFVNGLAETLETKQLNRKVILLFIRTHAPLGGYFLECVLPLFPKAAVFAFEHQEDIDGTGYPKGLSIDDLTIEGRIAHFADSYDALVTRQNWSSSQVCDGFHEKYEKIGRSDDAVLKAFVCVVERQHTEWYKEIAT